MKKIKILLFVVLGIVLIILVCFILYFGIFLLLLSDNRMEIQGVVTDARTQKPIPRVNLTFDATDTFSSEFYTTTDTTGFYHVRVYKLPQKVTLIAHGYLMKIDEIGISVTEESTGIKYSNFKLEKQLKEVGNEGKTDTAGIN